MNDLINSLAPINALPVEILTEILQNVQACHFRDLGQHSLALSRWIAVSSVCVYWRTLVVSNPLFWRSIAVQRAPELLTLSLERTTQGIPLAIRFEDTYFPWHSLHTILQGRASDVRALRFNRMDTHALNHFVLIFQSMPALEELYMHVAYEDDNMYPMIPLTHELFPTLQSLSLRALRFSAFEIVFSRLRRLVLCDCGWINFAGFLDTLETCTQLEELDLELSLPVLDDFSDEEPLRMPDGSRRPTVALPSVRTLRLARDPCWESCLILSYLHFPGATNITIIADMGKDTEDPSVNGAIISMLPRDRQTTFPILKTITSVDVVVSREVYEMCMRSSRGATVLLSLDSGSLPWREEDAAYAVMELPIICTVAPITSLHFIGYFNDSSTESTVQACWTILFKMFRSLETLHVTGSGLCRSMWKGLWGVYNVSDDGCCPSLRSIILDGKGADALHHTLEEELASVCSALRIRAQFGLRLHTLTLDPILPHSRDDLAKQSAYFDELKDLVADLSFFPSQVEEASRGQAVRDTAGARMRKDTKS
ncbi:hypothetical protein VTO73DRAFT_3969 [Trametes versicolor]